MKLITIVTILLLSGHIQAKDYSTEDLQDTVVEVALELQSGSTKYSTGIAIAPTVALVPTKAAEGLFSKLLYVNGQPATVARSFKDEGLSILSVPTANFKPVVFALEMPEEGRELKIVENKIGELKAQTTSLVSAVSVKVKSSGYFDLSIATSMLNGDGAIVFNNCGELLGIYDKSQSRKSSVSKNLDQLRSIALSSANIEESSIRCPTEAEKSEQLRLANEAAIAKQNSANEQKLEEIKKASEEKQRKAEEALEAANQVLANKREELSEAQREAQETLDSANEEALNAQREAELALQEAEDSALSAVNELELAQQEVEEALAEERKALEDLKITADAEKNRLLANQKRERVIFGALFGVLFLIGVIFLLRRKKKEDVEPELPASIDENFGNLILRGPGISLKIPMSLLTRESGVILGRSAADSDYVIDALQISRAHARLVFVEDVIYLTDLGSSNGTSINGLEVEGGKNIAVHDNDQIQLADAAFSVEINLS